MKAKSKYTKEELESIIKNCYSKAEALRLTNRRPVGGNYKTLDCAIKQFNLDISHFTGRG